MKRTPRSCSFCLCSIVSVSLGFLNCVRKGNWLKKFEEGESNRSKIVLLWIFYEHRSTENIEHQDLNQFAYVWPCLDVWFADSKNQSKIRITHQSCRWHKFYKRMHLNITILLLLFMLGRVRICLLIYYVRNRVAVQGV